MADQVPVVDNRGVYTNLGKDEERFLRWYKEWAKEAGLSADPNPDLHFYDYRAAYLAGEYPKKGPDGAYHWNSRFKYTKEKQGVDHPNRFVEGHDTTTWKEDDVWPPEEEEDVEEVKAPPPEEQRPGENVFDPGLAAFLQEEGLIDVVKQEKYIKGLKPMPEGQAGPGDPVWGLRNVPINVAEDMQKDLASFLKMEGWSLVNDPLPPMQRGEAEDLARRTAQEYRDLMIRRFGATIGPMTPEQEDKAARMPIISPTATARRAGVPTIGPATGRERVISNEELADLSGRYKEPYFKALMGFYEYLYKQPKKALLEMAPVKFSRIANEFFKGMTLNQVDLDYGLKWIANKLGVPNLYPGLDVLEAQVNKDIRKTLGGRDIGNLWNVQRQISRFGGAFVPIGKILGGAAETVNILRASSTGLLKEVLETPIGQRIATDSLTGLMLGIMTKPEGREDTIENRLKQVPAEVAFFTVMGAALLSAEQISSIIEWNRQFKAIMDETGGVYGERFTRFTYEVPGRQARVERAQFSAQEVRDLFRKMERNLAGANEPFTEAERAAMEDFARPRPDPTRTGATTNGWREAMRRGWVGENITIAAEPPTVYRGYTVSPMRVPRKPQYTDIFRRETVPVDVLISRDPILESNGNTIGYREVWSKQRQPNPKIPWTTVEDYTRTVWLTADGQPPPGYQPAPGETPPPPPGPGAPPPPGPTPGAGPGPERPAGGQPGPEPPPSAGAPPPGSAPPAPPGAPAAGGGARQQAPPRTEPPPPRTEVPPSQGAAPPPPPPAERPPIMTPPPPSAEAREAIRREGIAKKKRTEEIDKEVWPLNNPRGRLTAAQEAKRKALNDENFEIRRWLTENDIPTDEPEAFRGVYPRIGQTVYFNGQPYGKIVGIGSSNMDVERFPGVPDRPGVTPENQGLIWADDFNDPDAPFSMDPNEHVGIIYNHRDNRGHWPEHDADAEGTWKDPTLPTAERIKLVEQARRDLEAEVDRLDNEEEQKRSEFEKIQNPTTEQKLKYEEEMNALSTKRFMTRGLSIDADITLRRLRPGETLPRTENWPPKDWVPADPVDDEPWDWEVTLEEFKNNPMMKGEEPDAIEDAYYESLGQAIQDGDYIPVEVLDSENDWIQDFLSEEENWTTIDKRGEVITGQGEKAAPLVYYYDRKGLGTKPRYLTEEQLGEGKVVTPKAAAEKPPIVTPPPQEAPPPPREEPITEPTVKFKVTPTPDGGVIVESLPKTPPIEGPPPTSKMKPPEEPPKAPEGEGAPPAPEVPRPAVKPADEKPLIKRDQALRDAVERVKAGTATAADIELVSQAALRSERLRGIAEGYKGLARVDYLTGVGSEAALRKIKNWQGRPQIRIDLKGVRSANVDPERGHDWADENIFKPAGAVFKRHGRGLAFRKGGNADEFVILGEKGESVESLVGRANVIRRELGDAKVEARVVVGQNGAAAEKRLAQVKQNELAAGEGAAAASGQKPPTKMISDIPLDEWVAARPANQTEAQAKAIHRGWVTRALNEGKVVPDSVLKDYPDLAPYRVKPQTAAAKKRAEQRRLKATETPEEHTRRIVKSRQQAQKKRGKVGVPKDLLENDQLIKDIFSLTSGVKPMRISGDYAHGQGKISEEYKGIPKWLKNKHGMSIDDLQESLNRIGEEQGEPRYSFGQRGNPDLIDVLHGYARREYWGQGQGATPERDASDYESMNKELQAEKARKATLAEEWGLKSAEETFDQFIERMAIEATEVGLGEDEAWTYVEASIQSKRALQDKYKPIMNEGETFGKFLERMEKEAVAAGLEPNDALVHADRLLRKKTGSENGPMFSVIYPPVKTTGAPKGPGWFSGLVDSKGKPIMVADPELKVVIQPGVGNTIDMLSGQAQLDLDEKQARDLPEWKILLDRWSRGIDPSIRDFLETIKKIYMETDGYGRGPANNIWIMPPQAMPVMIEKSYRGHKGLRDFQLKWILAHDFAARLFQVPWGNVPFWGTGVLHQSRFPQGHPLAGSIIGGFLQPGTARMFINPHYMANNVLSDPYRTALWIRDIVGHELTHYFEPIHNEKFTSLMLAHQAEVNHLFPYLLRVAEQLTGVKAKVDPGQTPIFLGSGRSAKVDNAVIQNAGEETAKNIAEGELNDGDDKLYTAIGTPPHGRKRGGGQGGGEPGEPGPSGLFGAGGGPQLTNPPGAPEAGAAGLGVRSGRPVVHPPTYFARVKGDGFDVYLSKVRETDTTIQGIEVNRKGDEVRPAGFENRLRIIQKAAATSIEPYYMNPKYAELEPEGAPLTLAPTVEAPPPFKPTELIGEQRILPLEAPGELFDKVPAEGEAEKKKQGNLFLVSQKPKQFSGAAPKRSVQQMVDFWDNIWRLTTGDGFPREWMGKPYGEIEANRQALARYVQENWTPQWGPIEDFVNRAKGYARGGEMRSYRLPEYEGEPAALPLPKKAQPIPPPKGMGFELNEPEVNATEPRPNVFGSDVNEARRALYEAAGRYVRSQPKRRGVDILTGTRAGAWILSGRILQNPPESFESLSKRTGLSVPMVKEIYEGAMREIAKDEKLMAKVKDWIYTQANLGPIPSEADLKALAKMLRTYFSSRRGADQVIDERNDTRIAGRMAEVFGQTLDSAILDKWMREQPAGTDTYVHGLMTGAVSGNGYDDIRNSMLPDDIKNVLLRMRERIDRLSELIIAHGGTAAETQAAIRRNLGKYLTKAYRLWEDKHWDPTPADRQGFKDFLMQRYGLTDPQAENFIEQELAYARNDEGLLPRKKRKTRRVPTEHYIRRKELSPEWRRFAGEIDRVSWLALKTVAKQATMAYNAEFLDWIMSYLPEHWTGSLQTARERGWQNSKFPDNYAYGKLAGKWVDPELNRYIRQEIDAARSDIEEFVQKALTNPFKWTKTIGSYPTHLRNFLGNAAFSMLANNSILNPLNAKWYKDGLDLLARKTGARRGDFEKLIAQGVTETQFYGNDIPSIYKELMKFDDPEWYEKLYDRLIRRPIDKFGEIYNFEDALYRIAAYLKMTAPRSRGGMGMSPSEALEELNSAMQNYRKLPIAVDILRRWPVLGPFVSFKWNVAKIVGLQAKKGIEELFSPPPPPPGAPPGWTPGPGDAARRKWRGARRLWKLAMVLMIPMILSELSKVTNDVDDDDVKALERFYPDYRRNGTFFYFRDKNGELKVFDFQYIWPTGGIERGIRALLKGDVASLTDAMDLFSHPLFDIWSIVVQGKEPAFGTPVRPGGGLPRQIWDTARAAASYLYLPASMPIPNLEGLLQGDKFAPAMIPEFDAQGQPTGKMIPNPEGGNIRPGALTGQQFRAIIDAYNQAPDRYGRVKELPEEIKNFFTGIKTWSVEPAKLLAQAAVIRNAQIREAQARLSSWVSRNISAPKWEKDQKIKQFQEEIAQPTADLKAIGELQDKLKAGTFGIRKRQ